MSDDEEVEGGLPKMQWRVGTLEPQMLRVAAHDPWGDPREGTHFR